MWMKNLAAALTTGALLLAGSPAMATMAPVSLLEPLTAGSGVPGGGDPAKPAFSVQFTDYDLVSVGFSLTYDPSVLQFNPSQSSVTYNGVTRMLPEFFLDLGALASLSGGGFWFDGEDVGPGELIFNAGFIDPGSRVLNGTLTVHTAFNLLPIFDGSPAQLPKIESLLFVNRDGGYDELVQVDNLPTLSISAVPEPETWLMLLAGMGLLGAVAKRRSRHDSRLFAAARA